MKNQFSEIIQEELYDWLQGKKISKEDVIKLKESTDSYKSLALDINNLDLLKEAIDSKDIPQLRDIIRAEIASLLFDLFKKRNVWL